MSAGTLWRVQSIDSTAGLTARRCGTPGLSPGLSTTVLAMVLLAVGSFAGAIALQALFGGAGFIPVSDRSEISVIVETPPGSNLEYTRVKSEEVARITRNHPEVSYTYTAIGTPIPLRAPGVDQALIYVRLVPKNERDPSQDALGEVLRKELSRVGGANVSVFTSGFGGAFKQIQIEMRGQDPAVLTRLASQAAEQVRTIPGATDVGLSIRGERPELIVDLKRGLAGSLGSPLPMWRSRFVPHSPGSMPVTGSIQPARRGMSGYVSLPRQESGWLISNGSR